MPPKPITLGQKILERRRELEWTQKELAESVGTNQAQVSLWEAGTVEPRELFLKRLTEVLDLRPRELLDLASKPLVRSIQNYLFRNPSTLPVFKELLDRLTYEDHEELYDRLTSTGFDPFDDEEG